MKPFDLEKAKQGAPICTRNGSPAKYIAHVPEADELYRVVALIGDEVSCFKENGWKYHKPEVGDDLFMSPVKREGWVNVYCADGCNDVGNLWDTEDQARGVLRHPEKDGFPPNYHVATVKIEWEE